MGEVCLRRQGRKGGRQERGGTTTWPNFSRFSHSADFLREERIEGEITEMKGIDDERVMG